MTNPQISIVIDSTALSPTLDFQSHAWTALLSLARDDKIIVAIPEIVLSEVGRQWEKSSRKFFAEIRRDWAIQYWPLKTDSYKCFSIPKDKQLSRDIYVNAAKTFLEENKVLILDVPEISTRELLIWDLDERKPFNSQGKGFRDALIWRSLTNYATHSNCSSKLFFVSGNHSDFSEDGKFSVSLHSEIPDRISFQWVKSLRELTDTPEIQELSKSIEIPFGIDGRSLSHSEETLIAIDQLVFTAIESSLEDLTYSEIQSDYHMNSGFNIEGLDIPVEIEFLTIDSIIADHDSLKSSVFQSSHPELVIHTASLKAELTVTGSVFISEVHLLEALTSFRTRGWLNEKYLEVETTFHVNIEANVVLDSRIQQVKSCRIESISIIDQ